MRTIVKRKSLRELADTFPIIRDDIRWCFRVFEVSPNAYRAEGTDEWGRLVGFVGDDPQSVLAKCFAAAIELSGADLHEA